MAFYILMFALVFGAIETSAQSKTIVLVRHAEKVDETSQDPELSEAGKARAQLLVKKVNKYRPKEIFSTDFKRTRDTAAPIAAKRRVQVQIYDPRKPQELVDRIMKSETKRFVIVGHSNTVPGLANALGGKRLFRDLDDAEYGAIWVVKIKKGKVQKIEILNY